jgi:hypothetical protein
MIRSGLLHTATVVLLLCSVIPAAATSVANSESGLRQSVIALDRARHRAVHDLAEKRQNTALEENQRQDYKKFIVFLTIRIDEYCQQLRTEAGEASVEDLPCPEKGQSIFAEKSGSAQTSEEQVSELERALVDSLGQFDEKLLKEEERLAARQPKERETGYGGSQSQGSMEKTAGTGQSSGQATGASQTSGSEGTAGQGSGEGEVSEDQTGEQSGGSTTGTGEVAGQDGGKGSGSGEGAGPSDQGAGKGETAGSSPPPGKEELETGDDDIVARQLREAAEKETDPELKKKLWEEYRKYKAGTK